MALAVQVHDTPIWKRRRSGKSFSILGASAEGLARAEILDFSESKTLLQNRKLGTRNMIEDRESQRFTTKLAYYQ